MHACPLVVVCRAVVLRERCARACLPRSCAAGAAAAHAGPFTTKLDRREGAQLQQKPPGASSGHDGLCASELAGAARWYTDVAQLSTRTLADAVENRRYVRNRVDDDPRAKMNKIDAHLKRMRAALRPGLLDPGTRAWKTAASSMCPASNNLRRFRRGATATAAHAGAANATGCAETKVLIFGACVHVHGTDCARLAATAPGRAQPTCQWRSRLARAETAVDCCCSRPCVRNCSTGLGEVANMFEPVAGCLAAPTLPAADALTGDRSDRMPGRSLALSRRLFWCLATEPCTRRVHAAWTHGVDDHDWHCLLTLS